MNDWLDDTLKPLVLGEALLVSGVEGLYRGWQASAAALGRTLSTGAERWQAAIRQMQAPVNFADILKSRTLP